ncbi:ABC transporter substrate-binding protein [Amorphus coralli]|uniref:ABC transporter substrate-binding protein n=1 Tax=Amorphus coralli TaxID=340680 RepID=UPI0003719A3A|nr:ABC transporter substrate-binding protein [Amorphus coralli]
MVRITRRLLPMLVAALASGWLTPNGAEAQSRAETLRAVTSGTVNSLDPMTLGATPDALALSTATYDRLVAYERTPRGDGTYVFDFNAIRGELAESVEVSEDGLTITVHLRPDAVWQDGTPVTAEDVKWSLDRAVSAETMSKAQLKTGSLTSPDQFRVVDARTVEITLPQVDRLALPNLASLYAPMFNSALVKREAGPDDPWGVEWLKTHTASSGAYAVESYKPGQQVVLTRNDDWSGGELPAFPRVIVQTVPDASTRAALVERGDADVATDLQGEDVKALRDRGEVQVVSVPRPTAFMALVFNTRMAPFDDAAVRRAVALALPYDAMLSAAASGLGGKLYGAEWQDGPEGADFPQALPLATDPEKARALLAEAGYPDGFETTLSFAVNRAAWAEPAATLVQEALGGIGIEVTIDKLPDAQMAEAITEKRLPLLLERSYALFPSAEYFFRIFLSGPSRWNFSSWRNEEVEALLPKARYEADQAAYDAVAKRLIALAAEEVPMAFLWQPTQDVVLGKDIEGFTTWYHYYVDVRDLQRR